MLSLKKTTLAALSTSLLILGGLTSTASAESLTFDAGTEKSSIKFVSEAPQEKIVGTASKIEGKVSLDLKAIGETTGTIKFPVATMNTGNDTRDEHLRSSEWLNAEKNPNIIFEIKSLKDAKVQGDDKKKVIAGTAVGTVTVNGKPAVTTAKVKISILSSGKAKVEFKDLNVTLAEHNVSGTKGTVGAKVGQTIAVTGTLYGKYNK